MQASTPKTVLIVDDQTDIIKLIVKRLRIDNEQWRILSAPNGQIALTIAAEELPDIILMDWDMPVLNGIDTVKALKRQDQTFGIPVVMMTGRMTGAEDLQTALEAGAIDFVRKPIDFTELKARVNSVLKLVEQQTALERLLKNEIDLKNRKLSTTSMLIVEKNNMMREFHDQLEGLVKLSAEGVRFDKEMIVKELKSLIKRSENHLEKDDSWETFKLHFEEVHPDFLLMIKNKGKDISHKDIKLCAYIKLGMETKQIAQLLNITPASIRTAMYRLKKKFEVPDNQDLRNYIEELV